MGVKRGSETQDRAVKWVVVLFFKKGQAEGGEDLCECHGHFGVCPRVCFGGWCGLGGSSSSGVQKSQIGAPAGPSSFWSLFPAPPSVCWFQVSLGTWLCPCSLCMASFCASVCPPFSSKDLALDLGPL